MKTVVVKLGGSTLGGKTSTGAPDTTLEDLLKLAADGVRLVVVHGGGNAINGLLTQLGLEAHFYKGLRVTDQATLEAALMKMRGQINAELVAAFNRAGGKAIGLCGLDGRLIEAQRELSHGPIGLVGEIINVNPEVIEMVLERGFVPFVAPFGTAIHDEEAVIFNINADNVASHIAAAIKADACVFLTDVPGVLDKNKRTIQTMTPGKAQCLIQDGTISGGMIPKIESAVLALHGAKRVLIIDGKQSHALYDVVQKVEAGVPGTVFVK